MKLADYLENVVAKNPESFDLGDWAYKYPKCGAVCCAVGHACDIPEFKADGLRLEWHPRTPAFGIEGVNRGIPVFGESRRGDAAQAFFELAPSAVDYLFTEEAYWEGSGVEYPEPVPIANVIRRIREYVAHKTPVLVGG